MCITIATSSIIVFIIMQSIWVWFILYKLLFQSLVLLTLSVSLSALKPPDRCEGMCSKATHNKIGVFFLSLYRISLGIGGHKPSLQAVGAYQFDKEDRTEKLKKSSFFNFWYFGLLSGPLSCHSYSVRWRERELGIRIRDCQWQDVESTKSGQRLLSHLYFIRTVL